MKVKMRGFASKKLVFEPPGSLVLSMCFLYLCGSPLVLWFSLSVQKHAC